MGIINLSNITKRYGTNTVLDNFSLEVEEGDYISITGPSGKGKTTILNIIGMLDLPDSGELEICECRNPQLSSKNALKLRRYELSYLFQNYGLIDTDIVDRNIEIALQYKKISKGEKKQKVESALNKVGLSGYEKRKVFTLSGGEQQRVALAKIIAKSPRIILADEPTGSLDGENRDYVLKILEDLNKEGKTVIVVTHDPCVSRCAKKHICL